MESKNEFKTFNIKNRKYFYFDDIMEVDEYINVDRVLLDEKYEDTLVYNIIQKNLWMQNHWLLGSIK